MRVLQVQKFFNKQRLSNIWQTIGQKSLLSLLIGAIALFCWVAPAWANLDDDRYDGNMFVIYAGNGSLVPPSTSLADSLKQQRPAIVVFYVDDSRDCKQYAIIVSRMQEYYGRAASIIPISVDALPVKDRYEPNEPGYYYQGGVPQTVIFDQEGKVRLNEVGIIAYEKADDVLREIFNLLPRSESVELKRRTLNEFNTELSQ
ncbi:thylakoid membrane photosystem I accumulation factor [Spirulina subsalsa FACHB-351]|uniref:Thylakoid membrane photosystem I accumulation factor n=1 Tax=Spirulina subsalsa FACHB-351 TaxID=234711 RepID=A0ABT3LAP7_9CYAN|nr:thylakoid membrane photosystem I accumulation factor [Spirulina subsalsa]MCW6038579.1 thylakoid membrane photosystem I accumulation factor [Spirulina subsalsa FACHB-351]